MGNQERLAAPVEAESSEQAGPVEQSFRRMRQDVVRAILMIGPGMFAAGPTFLCHRVPVAMSYFRTRIFAFPSCGNLLMPARLVEG